MRAGVSRSAAITRARSSVIAAGARSMTRYWMGLLSGTGLRLGEQGLHDAQRFAFVPVALAEGGIAHGAARIDDERHRQAAGAPRLRRFLVAIEHHRQRDAMPLEEPANGLRALAEVHRDDLEGLP